MAGLGWAIPLNLSAFFQKAKGCKLGGGVLSSQTQLPHQGAGGGRRHSDPWGVGRTGIKGSRGAGKSPEAPKRL